MQEVPLRSLATEPCLTCGVWQDAKDSKRQRSLQEIASVISTFCTPTQMVYQCVTQMAEDEKNSHRASHQANRQGACLCVTNCEKDPASLPSAPYSSINLLLTCHLSKRCTMCESCYNWLRRVSKRDPYAPPSAIGWKHRTMVPMDEFLLFVAHPGHHRMPDRRTMCRMLQALSRPSYAGWPNPYKSFAPMYIHTADLSTQTDELVQMSGGGLNGNEAALHVIVSEWFNYNGRPLALCNAETSKMIRDAFDLEEQLHRSMEEASDQKNGPAAQALVWH